MTATSQFSRRLLADQQGNLLPLAAVGMVAMAAMIGGAVDVSRLYRVQNRLQAACDAGALAGRKTAAMGTTGFDSTALTAAQNYFKTNFDDTQEGVSGTTNSFTADSTGNTVTGSVSTKAPMALMQIFGFGAVTISASCTSTMSIGNADVTMVLDNTGSMADTLPGDTQSKIAGLRSAMSLFYSTVATATANTTARIRYAFVPFSSAVNVGGILTTLNPSYISNSYSTDTAVPYYTTSQTETFSGWKVGAVNLKTEAYASPVNSTPVLYVAPGNSTAVAYSSLARCMRAIPADTAWANSGSPSTSTFSQSTGTSPSTVTGTKSAQKMQMTAYTCFYSSGSFYPYYYTKTKTVTSYSYATGATATPQAAVVTWDHSDYKPQTFDVTNYKAGTSVTLPVGTTYNNVNYLYVGTTAYSNYQYLPNGSNVTSTWGGCIEERDTTPASTVAYSSSTNAITPSSLIDLDIDSAPTSDETTKWTVLWPEVQFWRNNSSGSNGLMTTGSGDYNTQMSQASLYSCPAAASILATRTASDITNYANTLTPTGGTYLDVGMLWGARVSSPTGIWSSTVAAAPTNGGNVSRHIIFMTDGYMDTEPYIAGTYGIEQTDRHVTTTATKTDSDTNHSARLHAICDAIKARGIRLWIIAFISSTDTPSADLTYCASPNSMYTATSSAALQSAFQSIAGQVSELRVTQ